VLEVKTANLEKPVPKRLLKRRPSIAQCFGVGVLRVE
jgi:hypothetical protein